MAGDLLVRKSVRSMAKIYVYDKRIGKVVEKRSRDNIELLPEPESWFNEYLKLMQEVDAIFREVI